MLANTGPESNQCITHIERYYDHVNGGSLHLDNCDINDRTMPTLIDFSKTHSIKLLDLRFNNITAKGITQLSKQMKLNHLRISYNAIGDLGAIALAKNETLEQLAAVSTGMTDKGGIALSKQLRSLSIGNDAIGSSGFLALGKSKTLDDLILTGNLPHENVTVLSRSNSISVLGLGRVSFENPSDVALLAKMPNLTELFVYGSNIGDTGAVALSTSTHYHDMTIDLVNSGISDIGVSALASMNHLHSLNLSNFDTETSFPKNNIGVEGLTALQNSMIDTLYLKNNHIDDEGAAILANNTSINSLELSQNSIGNKGALSLSQNNTLNRLFLYNNPIEQEGRAALEANTTLKTLELDLHQAAQNSNDAVFLMQLAERGMSQVSTLLQQMRVLSVQAANGTNTAQERYSLQLEVDELVSEIDDVANNTQFNGYPILNGSFNTLFKMGDTTNETTLFSISSVASNAIGYLAHATGSNVAATPANDITLTVPGNPGNPGTIKIKSSEKFSTKIIGQDATSAYAKVAAINASNIKGLSANALTRGQIDTPLVFLGGLYELEINGVLIFVGDDAGLPSWVLVEAINAQSKETGVIASLNDNRTIFTLTADDGRNIIVTERGDTPITRTGNGFNSGTALTGTITLTATNTITIGGTIASIGFASSTILADTAGITSINVSFQSGAEEAIQRIDSALQEITLSRMDMSAMENRLETTINTIFN